MNGTRKRTIFLITVILVIVGLVLFFGRSYLLHGDKEGMKGDSQKESAKSMKPFLIEKGSLSSAEERNENLSEKSDALRKNLKVKKSDYERLREEVIIFFDYLDSKDYVKSYEIEGGTYEHSKTLIAKLAAEPPVVSGETKDLFSVLRNMAHFLRILGRENISLIKDVLYNEKEIAEPAVDMLFHWIIMETERKNSEVDVSLANLYEYAGFFLNTLAGKAYLARRGSKVRILITYYSIVVLDMANKKRLNRHGIDILPPLNLAIDDISRYIGLENKKKYLSRLADIKKSLRNRI